MLTDVTKRSSFPRLLQVLAYRNPTNHHFCKHYKYNQLLSCSHRCGCAPYFILYKHIKLKHKKTPLVLIQLCSTQWKIFPVTEIWFSLIAMVPRNTFKSFIMCCSTVKSQYFVRTCDNCPVCQQGANVFTLRVKITANLDCCAVLEINCKTTCKVYIYRKKHTYFPDENPIVSWPKY